MYDGESQMNYNKKSLIIGADTIIFSLLQNDKRYYVDVWQINQLCDFIKRKIVHESCFDKYQTIVFDTDYNAIARTVQCHSSILDLVEDRIYLKCSHKLIPKIPCTDDCLRQIINDFMIKIF